MCFCFKKDDTVKIDLENFQRKHLRNVSVIRTNDDKVETLNLIEKSAIIVFLITNEYLNSDNFKKELKLARKRGKKYTIS